MVPAKKPDDFNAAGIMHETSCADFWEEFLKYYKTKWYFAWNHDFSFDLGSKTDSKIWQFMKKNCLKFLQGLKLHFMKTTKFQYLQYFLTRLNVSFLVWTWNMNENILRLMRKYYLYVKKRMKIRSIKVAFERFF